MDLKDHFQAKYYREKTSSLKVRAFTISGKSKTPRHRLITTTEKDRTYERQRNLNFQHTVNNLKTEGKEKSLQKESVRGSKTERKGKHPILQARINNEPLDFIFGRYKDSIHRDTGYRKKPLGFKSEKILKKQPSQNLDPFSVHKFTTSSNESIKLLRKEILFSSIGGRTQSDAFLKKKKKKVYP